VRKEQEEKGGREEGGGYPTIPPGLVRRVCSLSPGNSPTAPGSTMVMMSKVADLGVQPVCTVTGRVAQEGELPWVAGILSPLVFKSVIVPRLFCAELLRSSG